MSFLQLIAVDKVRFEAGQHRRSCALCMRRCHTLLFHFCLANSTRRPFSTPKSIFLPCVSISAVSVVDERAPPIPPFAISFSLSSSQHSCFFHQTSSASWARCCTATTPSGSRNMPNILRMANGSCNTLCTSALHRCHPVDTPLTTVMCAFSQDLHCPNIYA